MLLHKEMGQLTGINERWNPPIKLHLKKRPESITKEFVTEKVEFSNGTVKLAGTLVKPTGKGPFPALVVVHGNGDQGLKVWEYRSHAYSLARLGIAALIYDKRGVGQSSGDYKTATFDDLAGDAISGISLLRNRDDIKSSAVGLLGVSQGGWISAIASRRNKKPDFIVLLEGPAVSLEHQELDRVKYSMLSDGFSAEAIDSALEHTRLYFDLVNSGKGWEKLAASNKTIKNARWAEYVLTSDSANDPDLEWWYNNKYDPSSDLKAVTVPVLAIFGEIDTAVPDEENLSKMQNYLTTAGVDFKIAVIPDLPHSVTTYQGLYGGDNWDWPKAFWNWSNRPFVLDETMAGWIFEHSKH